MKGCTYTILAVIAVAALSLSSCKDDYYDNTPDEPLRVSVDTIRVGNEAQKATIGVTARGAWAMTGSEPWCTVNPASGETGTAQVTVAFASNDPEEIEGAKDRTTTFVFSSGGAEKSVVIEQLNVPDVPLPNENPDKPINTSIYDLLKEWYYNGEPRDVAADTNQSYDDFYFNYLSHLSRNEEFDGNVWASNNQRYLYSYIERNPAGTADVASSARLNYGMEFDLGDFGGRLVGRVLYVEPGSPAAAAGLRRGEWFYKVGDVQLQDYPVTDGNLEYKFQYNRLIDSLVHPVRGKEVRLGMFSYRAAPAPGVLVDEGRTVTITPGDHPNNPILHTQVIEDKRSQDAPVTGYTGYMMYNSFDPAYERELVDAFRVFKAFRGSDGQPIGKFILDLRYNKSGTVEMAELMGNLLVGDAAGVAGTEFAGYRFNGDTAGAHDRTATFASHSDGVGVDTVFVLTSAHTAGASELLINALRGIDQNVVKLVMIGDKTQGMAVGMVKQTYRNPGAEWEYSAWMLAFRCYNDDGDGNYQYGFVNNGGEVREWDTANVKWSDTWGWKGRNGSTEDPLLARAMDFVTGRETYPAAEVIRGSQQIQRTGYPREFCFPTNMTMTIVE